MFNAVNFTFKTRGKICTIKCTIFIVLSTQLSIAKYNSHCYEKNLQNLFTFVKLKPSLFNNNHPHQSLATTILLSISVNFTTLGTPMEMESYTICLFVADLFHLASWRLRW